MQRTKQDATDAIKRLKAYLRNDSGSLRQVESIQRYLGELRQMQSALKQKCEALEQQLVSCCENTRVLERKLSVQQTVAATAEARERQALREAKADRERLESVDQMEEQETDLTPEEEQIVESIEASGLGHLGSRREFVKILRPVSKRFRRFDKPPKLHPPRSARPFELSELIDSYQPSEVLALGQFAVVIAICCGLFAVEADGKAIFGRKGTRVLDQVRRSFYEFRSDVERRAIMKGLELIPYMSEEDKISVRASISKEREGRVE